MTPPTIEPERVPAPERVRLGLISDTHGLLRPAVFEQFAGVDRIIHAGDIGDPDLLIELETIAPVTAVWGNVDDFSIRQHVPERAALELNGWSIRIIHGQQLGSPTPERIAALDPDADLIVFGHSHRPSIDRIGRTTVVNPGSAGRARFGLPVTLALAVLDPAGITARIIDLSAPASSG